MSQLPLTIAISDYDHVRDFQDGRIEAEGIDANFLNFQVEEIFYRFVNFREWDVSEMSFGKYVALKAMGDDSLTSIPVFPSRVFRLSSIFVTSESKLRSIADLAGKKVGVPEWAQTAAIYTRGYLVHQAGIPLSDITWVQAGVGMPGRKEKVALHLPDGVSLTPVADKSLQEMLVAGEIDAIMSAHPPPLFEDGGGQVVRLLGDYQELEAAYFKETGIFPIMHTIAINASVADAHPWVLGNLLKAFNAAKEASVARAREMTASRFPIPWAPYFAEQSASMFAGDYWPYGIEDNRVTLDAFLGYSFEQGVCACRLEVEDLFAKNVQSSFKV
ncbi:MAG: hypothetical protein VB959_22455 [Rhodospirillales bacterium]